MLIVDRIEGDTALCEDAEKRMLAIPLHRLPAGTKAGSTLIPQGDGYRLAPEEEEARREKIRRLQNSLWEDE